MNIYTYGYKTLREVSTKLEKNEIDDNLRNTLDDMLKTMKQAHGIGLAANQIGISKRFFVLQIEDKVKKIINPEIIEKSTELVEIEEGCLSIPGIYKPVIRPNKIKVKYLNEEGNEVIEELEDIWARAFLHELDHLDGVLFVDKITPTAKSLIRKKLQNMKKAGLIREFE